MNALVGTLQALREDPTEVSQSEGVQGRCHRLLHLLNVFKPIALGVLLQLGVTTKGRMSKRVRDSLYAHLCQDNILFHGELPIFLPFLTEISELVSCDKQRLVGSV